MQLEDGRDFNGKLSGAGAVADAMLLERLGVKVGDRFRIGEKELLVTGVLKSEPDGISDRLTYGPRVFVSHRHAGADGSCEARHAGALALFRAAARWR